MQGAAYYTSCFLVYWADDEATLLDTTRMTQGPKQCSPAAGLVCLVSEILQHL